MAKHVDDPIASATAVVVVVFSLAVAVTLIALQAYYGRATARELEVKVLQITPEERARVETEQRERLSGYRWVDRDAGVVSIPIERAMELVVREAAAGGGEAH
jgi:hypothetical protein